LPSKLLILDNYDSFTYNLAHLVEKVSDIRFDVFRNDEITPEEAGRYDRILLSPGPGLPSEAGIMPELLKRYATNRSVLGICLGLQAIGERFGMSLRNLATVSHGIALPVKITSDDVLFAGCPGEFNTGRYHSWVLDEATLNEDLEVTAISDQHTIMALKHKKYDVRGVQFHPESILSEHGEKIIHNWLSR
jgi:anthranilate synthase component II